MSDRQMPVASIVIPYYGNRRRLLERTLHMLTHQTVPVQIVVGDDGDFLPYYTANDIEQAASYPCPSCSGLRVRQEQPARRRPEVQGAISGLADRARPVGEL